VATPGEEVHLRAFRTEREFPDGGRQPLWLHTSPEFAMKKLLVAGAGPIFQLARVWRNGEGSDLHAGAGKRGQSAVSTAGTAILIMRLAAAS
jgi:elongation factor P--(R)-beta-lysine ligase